jgi:hypothetical protein
MQADQGLPTRREAHSSGDRRPTHENARCIYAPYKPCNCDERTAQARAVALNGKTRHSRHLQPASCPHLSLCRAP